MLKYIQGIGGGIGLLILMASFAQAREHQILASKELERQIEWGTLSRRYLDVCPIDLINEPLHHGYTPLTFAVAYQRPVSIRLLIECGADPNLPDARGFTPLEVAAQVQSVPLFKQLILSGAQLTPDIAGQAATHDPLASYIYHATRIIQLGSNKDGDNYINNITACQAAEILSAVAAHADTITELKRVVRWGAEVNYTDSSGTTIATTARQCCKPELTRFALTQGLSPDHLLPGEYETILQCTTDWYQSYMIDRVTAYDRLVEQLVHNTIDYDFYCTMFTGPYRLNINKLLPDYGCVDALEIATRANNYDAVSYLIANDARNKKNALRAAAESGHNRLYWFLWWHR